MSSADFVNGLLGIASDGELTAAYTGQKPFKSPIKDIRALVRLYTPAARFQTTHVFMNKDFADKHGIKTLADVVKKKIAVRVGINRRGNMDTDVSQMLMTCRAPPRPTSKAGAAKWCTPPPRSLPP